MDIIQKYFRDLTPQQEEQFARLESLYRHWNEKINVISRKDIDQLYLRHVLHSLSIACYIKFLPNASILDAGTGGGFPGIPLAIMFPESNFTLVDSIGKKIKVADAIVDELNLNNCRGLVDRAEQMKEKYDFVVSRAVTTLPLLVNWVKNKIKDPGLHNLPNGLIALKGGDLSNELKLPYEIRIVNLSEYFTEEYFETKKIVHVFIP